MLVFMVLFITVVKRICAVLSSISCFILSGQQWWSHELDHQADTVCRKKVSTAYVWLHMSTERWLLSMATWHSWKFAQMWKCKVGKMWLVLGTLLCITKSVWTSIQYQESTFFLHTLMQCSPQGASFSHRGCLNQAAPPLSLFSYV